jgi:formylglycine-generating enzyme required for sulfatase activity
MDRRTVLLGSFGLTLPAAAQTGQSPQTKSLVVKARTGELADTTLYTNSFAVLIGITYPKFPDNLQIPQANSDIDDLKALLVTSYGFHPENILVLKDPQATKKGIEKALASLADRKRVQATDRVLVYFSCHGQTIKTQDGGDQGFLIPVDAEIDLKDTANPVPYLSECIPMDSLWRYLESCPARHRLLIADACFAGLTVQSKAFPKPSAATPKGFLAVPALQAIAAGGKGEEALVLPGLRNSAFTHKLLEVLRQAAASGEIVATSLLGAQLKTSVPDLCLTRTGGKFKQTPQFGSRGTEGEWLFVPVNAAVVPVATTPETVPATGGALSTSIRLELTGVPAGAKVTLDGTQLTGNVFTDDIVEKSKSFEVGVIAAGFKPYLYTVVVPRGGNVVHAVTLEAKPKPANRLTDYPALRAHIESLRPIPAGTFQMGSASARAGDDEKPIHSVTLSAFRMGATPVTFAVWKEYCSATGTTLPKDPGWGLLDDHPVVNVSWNDIMGSDGNGGFCAWASDIASFRLTLPTEAQWEYAARGGVAGQEFPWGNSYDDSKLWCYEVTPRKQTAQVVRTSNIYRNGFGLTDMVGNVYQWCSDLYAPYSSVSQTDPIGPPSTSGNVRCVRGGSWNSSNPGSFRCANRFSYLPDFWSGFYGFRLSAGPS